MTQSYFRLQISGSGTFDEPDNGLDLWPLDFPQRQGARVREIPIAASSGIVQQLGVNKQESTLAAVFVGDWDDKKTKEEALRNISFHQSDSSLRGRPVSVSFFLGGVERETLTAFVGSYNIGQRRGTHNIFDVRVQLTEA